MAAVAGLCLPAVAAPAEDALPRFREQVVDADGGVCYSMVTADVNADGKPDIVVVAENPDRVVWYENPTWKKRVIVAGEPPRPEPIVPFDVDGDGKTEFILGGHWSLEKTSTDGSVWLLKRPDDLDKPWTPVHLDDEPSMHRLRLIDADGSGKKELVCSTLMGRGTKSPDWTGPGAPQYILRRPADPFNDRWTREPINGDLHIVHGAWAHDWDGDKKEELMTASVEGISVFRRAGPGRWMRETVAKGFEDKRGSSEVRVGRLPGGGRYLASIEPWHGHQAVAYTPPDAPNGTWKRRLLVEGHKTGHAVWPADLTGTGVDSLVVGFRGQGKAGGHIVYVFHPLDAAGEAWEKKAIDDKDLACDSVSCEDFNGDGRLDVAAAGQSTKNVKIYWNEGK